MDITVIRGSIPSYNGKLTLTQRSNRTSFGDALKSTASKSDVYESETPARTKLSDQEIAELAGRYDPHNMTRDQYDAFLDGLMEKGALSHLDAMRLGYRGCHFLEIDPEDFATGSIACGWACVTSAVDSGDSLKEMLEDTEGDLMIWLESMMAQQDQGSDAAIQEKRDALKTLHDIVKRIQAHRL